MKRNWTTGIAVVAAVLGSSGVAVAGTSYVITRLSQIAPAVQAQLRAGGQITVAQGSLASLPNEAASAGTALVAKAVAGTNVKIVANVDVAATAIEASTVICSLVQAGTAKPLATATMSVPAETYETVGNTWRPGTASATLTAAAAKGADISLDCYNFDSYASTASAVMQLIPSS